MKICLDMRPALSAATGVGIYLRNLVAALSEIDDQNDYFLFSGSWKERLQIQCPDVNFHIRDRRIPVRLLNYFWHRYPFPSIEFLTGTDIQVVHSPSPLLIPAKRARRINTVHDLYFYFHPEQTIREMRTAYPKLVLEHCAKSDAIIVISEYTRQQLVEHLKIPSSKIYTIRHGSDPYYSERATDEDQKQIISRWRLDRPFFLFAGTQEPRKNLLTLLRAFQILPPEFQLVLAGPEGWGTEEWKDLCNERVVFTGYLSKQELRAFYQLALALVMPSWDEGFGLPLLEAMASETPVIASDIPPFHEVGNQAILYFDPSSPQALASCMQRIAGDRELCSNLRKKGIERLTRFSWKETARKTLELYNSL